MYGFNGFNFSPNNAVIAGFSLFVLELSFQPPSVGASKYTEELSFIWEDDSSKKLSMSYA